MVGTAHHLRASGSLFFGRSHVAHLFCFPGFLFVGWFVWFSFSFSFSFLFFLFFFLFFFFGGGIFVLF